MGQQRRFAQEFAKQTTAKRILLKRGKPRYVPLHRCISFSNQETLWNFERVLDQEKMNDFLQVMEKIGGEKEVFQKLYKGMPEEAYGPKSCYEIHCAYMGPLPVGIGILVITSGVGGIYDLGIVPYERNRGLGTSMTEYLIKRAHEKGVSLVTLQASSCAQNLYRRLGFQECGVVRKYSL